MITVNNLKLNTVTENTPILFTGEFCAVLKTNEQHENYTATVSWSLLGGLDKPIIVILGGISANRFVAYADDSEEKGWWEDYVGIGKCVDLAKFSVLSYDFIGGNECFRHAAKQNKSFGLTDVSQFSAKVNNLQQVSTFDQAATLNQLLIYLKITHIHAIIGCSYGGMVSLAFAERYTEKVLRQLIISAPAESHPRSRALRSVQRQIVKLGAELGDVKKALGLARQLGMITYRSIEEFAQRFSSLAENKKIHNSQNKLNDYLSFHGEKFSQNFNADAFLTLSASIDNHQVNAHNIKVNSTLVSVDSDELVFPTQIQTLAETIDATTQHIRIRSLFGHDAFLKEVEQLSQIIKSFLELNHE